MKTFIRVSAGILLFGIFSVSFLAAENSGGMDADSHKGPGMINPYLDYKPFPKDGSPMDYLDKKVTFKGRISKVVWQHMFRSPGDKPYIQECYIDPDVDYAFINQLVGYNINTFPFNWNLYEPEHLRFYGTFGVVTGSSKRPGKVDETYSEVYFDIVDIEMLWD